MFVLCFIGNTWKWWMSLKLVVCKDVKINNENVKDYIYPDNWYYHYEFGKLSVYATFNAERQI